MKDIFYTYFGLTVILTQLFAFNNILDLNPSLKYAYQFGLLKLLLMTFIFSYTPYLSFHITNF